VETGIYVRVSTDEQAQEGFSIRAQEQKLKDFARVKDWSIYKIYMDEGISGKNLTDRPAMQEMIADVESGAVKNVLVFKIDRLTRSTGDLVYLVDLFNQKDCAFNSLTESIDTQTASGRMFLKIIGIFAEFERENIIERTKVGIERKVREGYKVGGNTSYGYDLEKNQKIQTINEDEAEIVREVFDMFTNQGVAITDIARRLNVRKIPTKQENTWGSTAVRRLLANCNYVGNVRHLTRTENEYSVAGQHEGIIPQEQFSLAQKLLKNNKKVSPKKKPRANNYFSGFLVCGSCGYKLGTHNGYKTLKDGSLSVTGSYRCNKKVVEACKTNCSCISHKKVEKAFEEYIEKIADLDVSEQIKIETQKKQENEKQIKAYQDKLRQMETKEREAMALYVDNEMAFDSYREIKKLVDKEKVIINAELEKLQSAENEVVINKTDIINNILENWTLLSDNDRRQFLLQFMSKITLVTEKAKGEHFSSVKILDVAFLPSHEKQPLLQEKIR